MTVVIGLGNPGQKYTKTRHNIGFRVVDEFAKENNFPEFKFSKKFNSLLSENAFDILAKPQTFMNESGKAVKEILKNNPASNLIVIHDDIDLPVGKIKIVKERGSAGHKGVESIIKELKTKNFIRLRIGINPKQTHGLVYGSKKAKEFVLKKFTKEEQQTINKTIEKTAEALDFLIKNGLDKAMNEYN